MSDGKPDPQKDWVNAHMGRTSKETSHRLLTTAQPRPPLDAPMLTLRGVPSSKSSVITPRSIWPGLAFRKSGNTRTVAGCEGATLAFAGR